MKKSIYILILGSLMIVSCKKTPLKSKSDNEIMQVKVSTECSPSDSDTNYVHDLVDDGFKKKGIPDKNSNQNNLNNK